MHFWDILIVLYIFGFGTARLREWRLNHIHSINGAEVINASCSDGYGYVGGYARLRIPSRANRRVTSLYPPPAP